jgi:transposase
MKQKVVPVKQPAEDVIRDIRRETRRRFSAEEKIRIILDDPRGAEGIVGLYRRLSLDMNGDTHEQPFT